MPMALPLLAAGASIAAGVAAGASTIVGGLMIAGGVMSGIGAITGSKKLSKFGGLVSLAGGIGGLASGAWSQASQAIAEQAPSTATEALSQTPVAAEAAADAAAPAADAFSQAANPLQGVDNSLIGSNSQALQAAKSPIEPLVSGGGGYSPSTGVNPAGITNGVGAQSAINSPLQQLGHAAGDAWNGLKSGMSNVGGWIKDNKELAQLGGGIVGGAMNNVAKQRQMQQAYELEQEAADRKRQQYSTSVQGLQMPTYQAPAFNNTPIVPKKG